MSFLRHWPRNWQQQRWWWWGRDGWRVSKVVLQFFDSFVFLTTLQLQLAGISILIAQAAMLEVLVMVVVQRGGGVMVVLYWMSVLLFVVVIVTTAMMMMMILM